jgi:lambda family phage portal protein
MFNFLKRSHIPDRKEPAVSTDQPAASTDRVRARPASSGHRVGRRFYDAAETDSSSTNWTTTPLTADQVVDRNQRILVARSREQSAGNDYMKAFLRLVGQNIVGSRGIILQAQAREGGSGSALDQEANDAIESWWTEWSRAENCDVRGKRSFRLICKSIVNTAAKDGEYMVRVLSGNSAGPMGFSLQTLDPQRCPVDYNIDRLPDGAFVRQGIEFSREGRPLAYYFGRSDPASSGYTHNGSALDRVPADQIIHGFVEDIEGQRRGIPWAATALWRLNQMKGFERAALINARSTAKMGGFLEWETGDGPDRDDAFDEDEVLELEREEGVYQELPPGLRVKEANGQYPSGEFTPFHKAMLRGAGAGMGVSYVSLGNDLEGVNFSSIRQGVLDEREHWMDLQEWLIEGFVDRVYRKALRVALLRRLVRGPNGPLPASGLSSYQTALWQARRWPWVDPQRDINAEVTAKDNLLSAPSEIIRRQGRDPRSVWRQTAADIADMKAAGLSDDMIRSAILGTKAIATDATTAPKNSGDSGDEDDE